MLEFSSTVLRAPSPYPNVVIIQKLLLLQDTGPTRIKSKPIRMKLE